MMRIGIYQLLLRISSIFCLICSSLEFVPEDNYLINCGSSYNTSVDGRFFLADNLNSNTLSTPQRIFLNTSSNSVPSTASLALYQTARIFSGTSQYNFSIKKSGRHWIRLYFFPFPNDNFNLSSARFSVSAQTFTLLNDFQPSGVPVVKEYSLNITANNLVLAFTPSGSSFAFLNALEVISLPDELIPAAVKTVGAQDGYRNLGAQALVTVFRVNMGNETVSPQNDSLWRLWSSDSRYLKNSNLVVFLSNIGSVNYTRGEANENIAPSSVYGTGTKLDSENDPNTLINATWLFEVDPGFDYFIRFHFCNILRPVRNNFFFNVFLNSVFAAEDLNLSIVGAPYFIDAITRLSSTRQLSISVGPSSLLKGYPDAILNGLEIMKISNSEGNFDAADSKIQSSTSTSKLKVGVIVGLAVGIPFMIMVLVLVLVLVCRSRRRAHVAHLSPDHFEMDGESSEENKQFEESSIISRSKMGYRFPFIAVQKATENFAEILVIGVGGFGKVYKGVLNDGTKVAVKRGFSRSNQGFAEFRTEIEMLSQFRHRHLVSLIGYCDEKSEMIIIYEYMENGTLRDHLYGSDLPKLNWRRRLEICIGSARGIHYLHTGSIKAIIHRDVKSANILLDENLMAKVADFGISKVGPEINQTHVSTAVKGSFGYLDPEYLTMQQLTEKSDVYSFGVVMLEVLCGRPVIDPSQPREMVNLVEWAIKCLKRGELEKIVDSHIAGEIRLESLVKFKEIAEKCLAEHGADRPTMGDVLWNLECALQLQGNDPRQQNCKPPNGNSDASICTTQFSLGSLDGLAGVSMSKVFSQMVKAETTEKSM